MSLFPLQIITPDKIFFDGSVQRLVVRTTEGDIGILAKHEKYVAALPSGPVRITLEDGTERIATLSGGALKVSPSLTAILANAVECDGSFIHGLGSLNGQLRSSRQGVAHRDHNRRQPISACQGQSYR